MRFDEMRCCEDGAISLLQNVNNSFLELYGAIIQKGTFSGFSCVYILSNVSILKYQPFEAYSLCRYI
jgi:hypothetical protein